MLVEHDGYTAHRLHAGELEAVFVPSVGMIGASLRHRGEELLGQRAGLDAYATRGKTMGIPLLHPWANRLSADEYEVDGIRVTIPAEAPHLRREENGLPIHGLLAANPHWRVEHADDQNLEATFDYPGRDETLRALFPFAHELRVEVRIAPHTLSITTRLTPTAPQPVPVAFGWHPYFQLPGVPRNEWELELPARRHLHTDDNGIPTGETTEEPANRSRLDQTTYDDGYDDLAQPTTFALHAPGRSITATFDQGYPAAQVFAPPGQDLVAIEPMTAPTSALTTHRGLVLATRDEPYAARFTIRVDG
jgi:galactose mutarotase-like enzyme